MAGDWIKMRGNLWDDPRIGAICDATDQGEAAIIGGLYWLWAAADQHTEDGLMPGLSLRQVDRKTGISGFAQAMCDIGWIEETADGLRIVKFEEHNGSSAKRRCSEAQRKANSRSASAVDADKTRTASGHDEADQRTDDGQIPPSCGAREREEEEKNSSSLRSEEEAPSRSAVAALPTTPVPDFLGDENESRIPTRAVVKLGTAWELPEAWGLDAEKLGWQPDSIVKEAEKFRQHWVSGKGAGTRRSLRGWRQAWSNWLSNAEKFRRAA